MNHDPLHSLDQAATEVGRVRAAATRAADQITADLGSTRDADSCGPLLAGLSSTVIERIEAIRSECDELSGLLERAASLGGERRPPQDSEPFPAISPQTSAPAARVVRSAGGAQVVAINGSPPEPPAQESARGRRLWRRHAEDRPAAATAASTVNSEGVRLVVKQMAIAGAGRGEIERRLRIQFGVNDADGALNEIFGEREPSAQETA
jgi:hypothetical protein